MMLLEPPAVFSSLGHLLLLIRHGDYVAMNLAFAALRGVLLNLLLCNR